MRTISFLAGLACLAFAGSAAARAPVHTLTVQLPDGSLEQIRYTGDVAPTVIYQPQAAAIASPFAVLDRMEAAMDAQMAGMMREAAALTPAAFGNGAGVCVRSVRIVWTGGRPAMTQSTAGDCGAPSRPAPAFAPGVAPTRAPGTILVKNATQQAIEVASR